MVVTQTGWGAVIALMLVLPMSGCDRTLSSAESGETEAQTKWWGLVKENDSPKQAIDFTWEVEDAPGPFAKVVARAQYDVVNEDECGYVHPATGTAVRMTTSKDVPLKKLSPEKYEGTVFLDLLKDASYYGQATCRWEFTGLAVVFVATGSPDETEFEIFMSRSLLLSGETLKHFYPARQYPAVAGYSRYPSSGKPDMQKLRPEIRGSAFRAIVQSGGLSK